MGTVPFTHAAPNLGAEFKRVICPHLPARLQLCLHRVGSSGTQSSTMGHQAQGTVGIIPTLAPPVQWLRLCRASLQGAIKFCKSHDFWKKARRQQPHERAGNLTPEGLAQVGRCTAGTAEPGSIPSAAGR